MESDPPIEALHHIGVAVRSLDEALPTWTDGFGLKLQSIEEVPSEQVKVAILMAGDTRIELLEPTSDDSPVAKFLDKRGPGIHHLAFQVGDCLKKITALAAAGAPMLNTTPNPGAQGCKVAFVHPRYLGGVLAEIIEDPHVDPSQTGSHNE